MRQLVYTGSILSIMLLFTCGERKICSTIKKSQNIMNTTVGFLTKNGKYSSAN